MSVDHQHLEAQASPVHGWEFVGRTVSEGNSPSFESVAIRLDADVRVAPGEFVFVDAPDHERHEATAMVLCRVLDVHEVNPHEDAVSSTVRNALHYETGYAPEGESTVIYRVAWCDPIEEMPLLADGVLGEPREVRSLPRAGGAAVRADGDAVAAAVGLLTNPDDGLNVGNIHGLRAQPVVLRPDAIQRHFLIVGGTGSGKSYTRGVLAEELHALGIPQLNIDVNRELVDATRELGGRTLRPGKDFTLALSSLTREDILEMVAGHGVRSGTNIETLIGTAVDDLAREVLDGIRTTFSPSDLAERIEQLAPRLDLAAKGTLLPAVRRAQALDRYDYIGPSLDWKALLQPGAVVNIDCWGLPLGDLRVVVAAVARALQHLARRGELFPTVLSIDEFHLVCPKDERLVSTQVLREIARIGRHFGLGLVLTTQSPADVDRAVLKRLLTRFIHTIEPDQLDSLRGVFSDAPEQLVRGLPKLPRGTCLVSGVQETLRHATVVDVRQRRTTHGGQTPDLFDKIRRAGWVGKRRVDDR